MRRKKNVESVLSLAIQTGVSLHQINEKKKTTPKSTKSLKEKTFELKNNKKYEIDEKKKQNEIQKDVKKKF